MKCYAGIRVHVVEQGDSGEARSLTGFARLNGVIVWKE